MRDLVAAARMRALTGKGWWLLAVGGVLMCVLAGAGFLTTASQLSPRDATDGMVRLWFTLLLFSALFAANCVTRDYSSGAVGRSVLAAGRRQRMLAAGLVSSVEIGLAYGALAVALAAASPWLFLGRVDMQPAWTGHTTRILVGVFVVTVLAAPWGALVGWIARSQVVAAGLLLAQALLVDELVQHLAPSVGRFLLTTAMASVYGDVQPHLLSVPVALLVLAAWLAAAGWLAHRLVVARDAL